MAAGFGTFRGHWLPGIRCWTGGAFERARIWRRRADAELETWAPCWLV